MFVLLLLCLIIGALPAYSMTIPVVPSGITPTLSGTSGLSSTGVVESQRLPATNPSWVTVIARALPVRTIGADLVPRNHDHDCSGDIAVFELTTLTWPLQKTGHLNGATAYFTRTATLQTYMIPPASRHSCNGDVAPFNATTLTWPSQAAKPTTMTSTTATSKGSPTRGGENHRIITNYLTLTGSFTNVPTPT